MRRRSGHRHGWKIALAASMLAIAVPGCAGEFDDARATAPRGSLGQELYTLVCDRVGAQALREDITGASFHAVCHADASGAFADKVDDALLPPLDPEARNVKGEPVSIDRQRENRAHRIARIEALARRRDDLIAAFDASFDDEPIATRDLANPDPTKSCDPSKKGDADLRTELAGMMGRMTDLYNDDTLAHVTRALSRVMEEVEKSKGAQEALARFDARRGYRPRDIAMGIARPALSYPRLTELANALLRLLSGDTDPLGLATAEFRLTDPKHRLASERKPGKGNAGLVNLMAAMREELRTAKESPVLGKLATANDGRDPTLVRLNRPRGNLELARAMLLHEDDAFGAGSDPRWIVRRDTRGFAKVAVTDGQLPAPFVDATGPGGKPDGLADVDKLGRFITKGGDVPSPFADVYGDKSGVDRDAAGRVPSYEYLDVSKTFLASLAKDVVPLLEPDPKRQHETLMNLFGGFVVVAGAREEKAHTEKSYSGGRTLRYRGYRYDASPVVDLVYAAGQVLGDAQMDDTFALLYRLANDKPQVLARLIGVALEIKAIADTHPEATIPGPSTLWDEVLDIIVGIAQRPNLIEDVIRAFGDTVTRELPRSLGAYLTMRDVLTYDRDNLNGPPFNLTTDKVETLVTPVDRDKPDTGTNRSAFQRFIQVLHDVNGMSICTREGAVAHVKWNGVSMDYPSFPAKAACTLLGAPSPPDRTPLCGMFRIKNIAEELVNALLGTITLDVRDECMKQMMESSLTGIVGGPDAFLEEISGIEGFNTKPTVPAMSRLVFFDLPQGSSPGDTKNQKTLNFLKDLFDDPPTLACPPKPFTDRDGAKLNLRQCASFKDTVRGRDANATFPLEHFGFLEAAKPLARAFQRNDANLMFVNLFDTFHRHWGSNKQTKEECDPDAPKDDARWCSQDGLVTYEPLLADALKTDLFPALFDTVKELEGIRIRHCDSRDAKGTCVKTTEWDGVKVLAEMVKDLVDPVRNRGLTRRDGNQAVVRNDGTENAQVTPLYLLIDALKGFDQRLAEHAGKNPSDDRLPSWRRARSQIVDQLFKVQGSEKSARLANRNVERMLPVVISTLRSQVVAHCPDASRQCEWARKELATKAADMVTGPTFAGLMDVMDAIQSDEAARTELERLLVHLLDEESTSTLAALADLLQVFEDDENMTALLNAAADAAGPEELDKDGQVVTARGLILGVVEVLSRVLGEVRDFKGNRLCSREIDPNRTIAVVLEKLVAPQKGGKPSPIEIIIDVIADVNRVHPEETTKLEPADYGSIAREVSEFCTHPSRGLEQMYTVIKQATKGL